MDNRKSGFKLFSRIYLILSILEGTACLAVLMADPSEAGNALWLGYSGARLAVVGFALVALLFLIALFLLTFRAKFVIQLEERLPTILQNDRALQNAFTAPLFLFFICGFSLFLWTSNSPALYLPFFHRLSPLLVWLLAFSLQSLVLLWLLSAQGRLVSQRVLLLLKSSLLALGIYYLLSYLGVAIARIGYPFELEWVEGAFLDLLNRTVEGQPLYQQPTLEFAPYIGMPIFTEIAALFARWIGPSFSLMRGISLLASLGSAGLIYASLRKGGASRSFAFLGPAFFFACYAVTGAWFDLARVDSLYLFLMLLALFWLRFYSSWRTEVLAGLALALAALTKQTAVIVVPFMFLACLLVDRKKGWVFGFTFAGALGASFLALNTASQGWFWFYVFKVPSFHTVYASQFLTFFTEDARLLWIAFLLVVYAFISGLRQKLHSKWVFPLLFFLGALALSWSGRAVSGAYINHLIPMVAAMALIVPMAVAQAADHKQRNTLWAAGAYALLAMQLLLLVYNPLSVIPTSQDRLAGEQLVHFIEKIDGDVLIPRHPYLATMAGKPAYAHLSRFGEVLGFYGSQVPEVGPALRSEFEAAIRQGKFAAILLDNQGWMLRSFPSILDYYQEADFIDYENSTVFRPVSGLPTRPQFLYVRKESLPGQP